MNKKTQYEIILMLVIIVILFNLSIIYDSFFKEANNEYNITSVGSNINGTVYKITAGNLSSNETIGLILGVHPREHEIHEEINKTIYEICNENGTQNLTKKYVIYYVKTIDNLTSHDETRLAGENLANQYIVPNIAEDNPFMVLDVHEINPYYDYSNFIFSISNRNDAINSYIDKISNDVGLSDYSFTQGTSPKKVTKPIANKGIDTLLMEIDITSDYSKKQEIAKKLIESLDELTV